MARGDDGLDKLTTTGLSRMWVVSGGSARETVFDPAVAAYNGRVVKLIGDGIIVEFASVVDAVNCALSVQRSGAPAPDHRAAAIVLRIGINLGDVIMEGEDIYGDGVNIAARLESLAEPGGICISSIVNESIGNRIDVRFQDGGEITVKNIDRPIRIWRWQPGGAAANPRQPNAANPAAKAATASIAVLPFTNMSGDAEQEYFSDGISEDIIADLSKIAGLIVIARNSSFTYKGRSVDVRAVGPRARGAFRARRLDPPGRPARAHYRAAHRCGKWRTSLGRPLRSRFDRYFRGSGRCHSSDRRRAQGDAQPGGKGAPCRKRAVQHRCL